MSQTKKWRQLLLNITLYRKEGIDCTACKMVARSHHNNKKDSKYLEKPMLVQNQQQRIVGLKKHSHSEKKKI